jgi:MobA/VirD2-like, nuclease domain/TraI-like middle domain
MIGKAHSGSGFGGLTRYLLTGKKSEPKPERVEWTSARELALEDPHEAALLMRMTAAQGRAEKPVEHFSISLAPGEHLSREQWEKVVDRTLQDLGLEGHQVLIVAHRDTKQEHIHLMVNRVHPETFRAWDRWQDQPRLMASLRVREREFGLQVTPHRHDPDRLPERLMQAFIHTGEPPFMDYARAEARAIFSEARSWAELHERLAEKGLYLERKGQGLVVTDDHRHVKASSVDRGASLPALESRLGPYEERRPLLQEVDSDLRGDRRSELYTQVAPALRASHEAEDALKEACAAASRLKEARETVRSAIAGAYRNPSQVESRYFAHLDQDKALPQLRPAELGELRGTVLHAGRNDLPVGAEGSRAWEAAANELPRFATEYLRAQKDLARAEARLAEARQKDARLREDFRPQFAELDEIQNRSATLHERLLSMRPRDQIALVRRHGRGELERAARRSPEHAIGPLASRQRWMQNLSRDLNRVLDRRLSRTGLSLPTPRQSLTEWSRQAFRLGLHPLHAVQVLTRGGVPLADAARAVSLARAAVRNPAKTALWLTAKALGLPSLPVRMATMAWDLVRGQLLSR